MATIDEKIVPVDVEDEMRGSYIDYSMSVIVSRALPDVRDEIKPVHRRVFGHEELDWQAIVLIQRVTHRKREVLGKSHPMAILQCTIPWCGWRRIFPCATCWSMDRGTSARSMGTRCGDALYGSAHDTSRRRNVKRS